MLCLIFGKKWEMPILEFINDISNFILQEIQSSSGHMAHLVGALSHATDITFNQFKTLSSNMQVDELWVCSTSSSLKFNKTMTDGLLLPI